MDGMNEKELAQFEALIRQNENQNENLRQQIAALQAIIADLMKDRK